MKKKITLLVAALVIVGVCNSVVSALPSMGPPRALIGQDQWTVGLGYSYSQMDLEASGRVREDQGAGWSPAARHEYKVDNLTSNIVLGQVGYGVSESVDVFLCLGVSDAQDDMKERFPLSSGDEYRGLDGGFGFAWGLGARATFWQDGDVTWGGLLQVIWENPRDADVTLRPHPDTFLFFGDPNPLEGEAELELREIQVAVGPTVQFEGFCAYGGPFLHFVNGDIDISVSGTDIELGDPSLILRQELSKGDIEQESEFGFYAGLQGEADAETSWYAEYRITGDAWGIGIGAVRRFK